MAERPEYPETKAARWKALASAFAAVAVPGYMIETGKPEGAPYVFAIFLAGAVVFWLTIEMDRLHRRVDALRDGNGLRDGD